MHLAHVAHAIFLGLFTILFFVAVGAVYCAALEHVRAYLAWQAAVKRLRALTAGGE